MVRYLSSVCVCTVLLSALCLSASAQAPAAGEKGLTTPKAQVSYGFGLNVGRGILRDGLRLEDVEFDLLVAGLRDALQEKQPQLSAKQLEAAYDAFQKELAPKVAARAKEAADRHTKEADAFLAANKAKPGVQTTKSGLQYKVLKQGKGKTPKATDVVKTMYRGTLIDGTEFDASVEPIEFPVNRVIRGWTEALQLMKEGDKWQLVVPAALAYGEQGAPPTIAPNAVLVFDVELIQVMAETAPPPKK